MATFEKGDLVQVRYSSPKLIEEWMSGLRKVGPGDVGVVKFQPSYDISTHPEVCDGSEWRYSGVVTVTFPMIGTFGMHTSNLVLVQKAVADGIEGR